MILYQKSLGEEVTREEITEMRAFAPHFVCFPEYFFVDKALGNHKQTTANQKKQIQRIKRLSEEIATVVIGGSMPEMSGNNLYNTSFVYNRGEQLGYYRKKNLFFVEHEKITPGEKYAVFQAYGITFGVIICADVFYEETFEYMRQQGARIIFSPTFSLYKEESIEDKFQRDIDIYIKGAKIADSVIVKVCGVKSDYKDFLQARSLVANKNEILYRVCPDEEDKSMIIKQVVEV